MVKILDIIYFMAMPKQHVSSTGIEAGSPALGAWTISHQTASEVPQFLNECGKNRLGISES